MTIRALFAAALLGVWCCGCGGSSSAPEATVSPTPTPAPAPSGGAAVTIVMGASTLTTTAYAPNPISIPAGGTVAWMNNDATTHTSTSNDAGWNSGPIAPGRSFSRTFSAAGDFPYHCSIHPGMVGTVRVQ